MQYEFRVWKDTKKMPTITPQKAPDRLTQIVNAINNVAGDDHKNPDILIDTNALGEDVISAADISFYTAKIKVPVQGPLQQNENRELAEVTTRFIKMNIKGNLYLPLKDDSLTDMAKGAVGIQVRDLNERRDTVLLSKWAAAKPTDILEGNFAESQPYYRAVVLSIMTKAGDFRVISANNMYVESYEENYNEGEFGTFKLTLVQKIDDTSKFTVAGLPYEKPSTFSKIVKGLAEAATVAGTVAAVGGTVLKTTTETVEKFTGETDVTRKIKGAADATKAAGKTSQGIGALKKDGVKNLDKNIENISASGNEVVQKSVAAQHSDSIPLQEMEKLYLDRIKVDPEQYKEYLNASADKKREMLQKAAQDKLDRATITKYYEESSIDMEKVKKTEADIAKMKDSANSTDAAKTTENLVKKTAYNNNVSLSGANLTDMLNSAANKKNGNSQ